MNGLARHRHRRVARQEAEKGVGSCVKLGKKAQKTWEKLGKFGFSHLLLDGTAAQKCFVAGAHAGHVNDGQLVILPAVACSRQKVLESHVLEISLHSTPEGIAG